MPAQTLRLFCSGQALIYLLEAWAQCLALWAFRPLLSDSFLAFCDNDAARHALLKGYGKDPGVNCLISMFWSAAAATSTSPWLERVSSSANLSDQISRNDYSLHQRHGWVHLQLDCTPLWPILARAIHDLP